ncbi:GH116 family glycosyl-hydrolase [bacterium]
MYSSKDRVKSGIPLGGIGTGKIEILPNGCFDNVTFLNNWRRPISNEENVKNGYDKGILGFHFGVFIKWGNKKIVRLLQTEKIKNYPTIQKIEFVGTYPKAVLRYFDKKLPVDIRLEAYSPIVPNDYELSSLPGAIFKFDFKSKVKESVEVMIFMIARNIVGKWYIGRTNKVCSLSNKTKGIHFTQEPGYDNDETFGDFTISNTGNNGYYNAWNSQQINFIYNNNNISLEVIDFLKKYEKLPKVDNDFVLRNENIQLCSSICERITLNSDKTQSSVFTIGWHFPHHEYGHYYERKYKNSLQVCKYLEKNKAYIIKKINSWIDKVSQMKLPLWLEDGLLNNLYVLTSGTWYTRDGDFSIYESPFICPLMGTLDVGFYGTIPIAFLFPKLAKNYLQLFANAQRKDGYIPHDLGFECLNRPSDGTTFYQWKDLNSKFILMLYRDYLWTDDLSYLKKLYPNTN